jgi:glycosyltransferase involved in cell wall biosynthesis
MPKVSVLIVTYNQEDFIAEALDAILSQTFQDFEIIVGDDCSKDKTKDILKEYKTKYPDKIKLVFNEKNLGITGNCNSVLKHGTGKYYAIMGGDDLMLPTKLEKQYNIMEQNPESVMCYHNVEVFDNDTGKKLYDYNGNKSQKAYSGNIFEKLIEHRCFVSGAAAFFKASSIPKGGYNPKVPVASDWLFCTEMANLGNFEYIDENLSKYRRHSNNITHDFLFDDVIKSYDILEQKYPDHIDNINKGRCWFFITCAVKLLKAKQIKKSFNYLIKSIKCIKKFSIIKFIFYKFLEQIKQKVK